MKTTTVKKLLAISAVLISGTAIQAALIDGTLDYNENVSGFQFDGTSVTFNPPPADGDVNDATGDLAPLIGDTVFHSNFMYNPFGGLPGPLFTTSSGFSFELTSVLDFSYMVLAGGNEFLNIVGIGTGSLAGYDDTTFRWRFTATEDAAEPELSNYAAILSPYDTMRVPDGGTTLTLLGFGIAVVMTAARVRSKRQSSAA